MTKAEIEKIITEVNQEKLKEHTEMRKLLVEIIQTFDSQLYSQVQDTNNPVGFLRNKIDKLLNK